MVYCATYILNHSMSHRYVIDDAALKNLHK